MPRKMLFVAGMILCAMALSFGAADASNNTMPLPAPRPTIVKASYEPAATADVTHPAFLNFVEKLSHPFKAPHRLSDEDAARYANIFAFQDMGEWKKADHEISRLKDKELMGHVLYQRYMSPTWHSSYKELKDWLAKYYRQPGARKIYDLAVHRRPKGASYPHHAVTIRGVVGGNVDLDKGAPAEPYVSHRHRTAKQRRRLHQISRDIEHDLGRDRPTYALKHYLDTAESKKLFDPVEYDQQRADIAASYFYNHKISKAFELASAAADRSGKNVPLAGWIAGLSAWEQQAYGTAARYFEQTARSSRASSWMVSGGAYWAARAQLRNHHPEKVSYWLHRAADYPRSFYGIIALKALGLGQADYNWTVPKLTEADVHTLLKLPSGRRALALIDADQPEMAKEELMQINPSHNKTLRNAMVALASKAGLPDLAMKLGSRYTTRGGDFYDAALYPVAPWAPPRGFDVDRALVYAFIRQESKFDPSVRNRSGATGLMQLMPHTASHLAGLSRHAFSGSKADKLFDPILNINLGQKYLADLLANRRVNNNLFKLAVAYNAGPGKLGRWERETSYEHDPLLFIESIPVQETREFVERVMANYWIYRQRFDQDTPSLNNVAAGEWPRYVAQDMTRKEHFASLVADRFWQ